MMLSRRAAEGLYEYSRQTCSSLREDAFYSSYTIVPVAEMYAVTECYLVLCRERTSDMQKKAQFLSVDVRVGVLDGGTLDTRNGKISNSAYSVNVACVCLLGIKVPQALIISRFAILLPGVTLYKASRH